MSIALVVLSILCGILLIQYIRGILEIRFICRQLEEVERGAVWK